MAERAEPDAPEPRHERGRAGSLRRAGWRLFHTRRSLAPYAAIVVVSVVAGILLVTSGQ